MTEAIITHDAIKPFCLTCQKAVDRAVYTPMIRNGERYGRKLIYECHGDTETAEVLESWFLEGDGSNEQRPFRATVFPVPEHKKLSTEEAVSDVLRTRLRQEAITAAELIQAKLKEYATISKGVPEDQFEQWLVDHKVRFSMSYPVFAKRERMVWSVYVDTRIIATVESGWFPDETLVQWIPFVKK